MLDIRNLTVRYGARTVVDNVSFSVKAGQWLMLVGPNGAGKSTIVNCIAQGVPYRGAISIDGIDVKTLKPRVRARKLGVLMQSHSVGYAFTVEEVVRLGRYAAASSAFSPGGTADDEAVAQALAATGMDAFRNRSVLQLSGGELQRTFLAQLLAQDPPLLLLDEPTNHLDLAYQRAVFELMTKWLHTPGRAIVSVVHDLSLARKYGTHALLLEQGKTIAQGEIGAALSRNDLARAYDMDVQTWMRTLLAQWNGKGDGNGNGSEGNQ